MRIVLALLFLTQTLGAAPPQVGSGSIVRLEQFASEHVAPRDIDIWLPDDYPKAAPYAVLYMHDGQMLFDPQGTWNGQEWRADEVSGQLQGDGKTRAFIIVGIANGEPGRHSEYFPQRAFAALAPAEQNRLYALRRGDAPLFAKPVESDRYLKFLVDELKPYIDAHYAVDAGPDSTVIMGASMGGLISLYALSEYPHVFGAAACLSSHWSGTVSADDKGAQQALLDWVERDVQLGAHQRLYMDRGDASLDAWYPALQSRVDAMLRAKAGGQFWSMVYPGADHSELAWGARLHVPLQFLLPARERR